MTHFKTGLLAALTILFISPILSAPKLFISEHPIYFSSPIQTKDKAVFVSARELLSHLNAKLLYKRKNDQYIITKDQKRIGHFNPNSDTLHSTQSSITMTSPTYYHNGHIFIELDPLLSLLGYTAITDKDKIYITDVLKTPIKKTENTSKKPPIFTTQNIPKTRTYFPEIQPGITTLIYENKTFNITNKFHTNNNVFYTNINDLMIHLGYSIATTNNTISFSKNQTTYTFNPKKNGVTIQSGDTSRFKHTNYEIHRALNEFRFPLHPFAKDLGYSLYWNKTKRTIRFLSRIDKISVTSKPYQLVINNSSIGLNKPHRLRKPNRLYWDIPNSKLTIKNFTKLIKDPLITRISAAQHKTTTRITLTSSSKLTSKTSNSSDNTIITLSSIGPIPKSKSPSPKKQPKLTISMPKIKMPSAPKNAKRVLYQKKIYIDPGHGGRDPGAISKDRKYEKHFTLDISKRLEKKLKSHGATIFMARTGDNNPSLNKRAREANSKGADILISIHINSFIRSYANGTESYYYKPKDKRLATVIQNELSKSLKTKNNGTKKAMMYILHHTNMPGVLVEPCFMTNPSDYNKLKNPAFRELIATALFNGIVKYFSNSK